MRQLHPPLSLHESVYSLYTSTKGEEDNAFKNNKKKRMTFGREIYSFNIVLLSTGIE